MEHVGDFFGSLALADEIGNLNFLGSEVILGLLLFRYVQPIDDQAESPLIIHSGVVEQIVPNRAVSANQTVLFEKRFLLESITHFF